MLADILWSWLQREVSSRQRAPSMPLPPFLLQHNNSFAAAQASRTARCYSLGAQSKTVGELGKPPSISKRAVAWRTASCRTWPHLSAARALRSGSVAFGSSGWAQMNCDVAPAAHACPKYQRPEDAKGRFMYCYAALPLLADGAINRERTRKVSPGIAGLAAGALLLLPVDTRVPDRKLGAATRVHVGLFYLTSHESMGVALVGCMDGCSCRARTIDAHRTIDSNPAVQVARRRKNSAEEYRVNASTWDEHVITVHGATADCTLAILILNRTSSGGHKFKVSNVNVYMEDSLEAHA